MAWRLRACLWQSREELILVKDLSSQDQAYPPAGVQIVEIADRYAAQLAEFNARHRDAAAAQRVAHYLELGFFGFLGVRDGKIVGYQWWVDRSFDASRTHPHVQRYSIPLEDDDVYGFDYFVAPQYRGSGTGTAFFGDIQNKLRRLGYRKMWGVVFKVNIAARWLYSLYGHQTVRLVKSYVLFTVFLFSEGSVFVKRGSIDYRRLVDFGRKSRS